MRLGIEWVRTIRDADFLKSHEDWHPDFDNLCNESLLFSPKITIQNSIDYRPVLPSRNSFCRRNKNLVRWVVSAACKFHLLWDVQSAGTGRRIELNIECKIGLSNIQNHQKMTWFSIWSQNFSRMSPIFEYIPNTFEIFSLLRSLRLSVKVSSVSISSMRSSFELLHSSNFA